MHASLLMLWLGCSGDETPQDSEPVETTDDTGTLDTADTGEPDPCATPTVTFIRADGREKDMSDYLISGDYLTLAEEGRLEVCPGEWFTRIRVRANVQIVGLGDAPEDTLLSGGESGTILDVAGPDVTVSVSNLQLDRGAGLDPDHNSGGGGLYCAQQGALELSDLLFTNNYADDGAALYTEDCTVVGTNLTMRDNYSDDDGGALRLGRSTGSFDGLVMSGNSSLDGGAAAFFESTVSIQNAEISNNTGTNFAAGIWSNDNELTLTDVVFSGNVNNGSSHYGGALITRGNSTLNRVTFTSNSGPLGGGLFVYVDSTTQVINSDFSDNSPHDVYAHNGKGSNGYGGTTYTAGAAATFTCSNNTCAGL